MNSEVAISSLAILKVNWDEGHDYIDNFVPFVAECLRHAPEPVVSLPALQAAIEGTFALKIPQGALRTILRRTAKHGYVQLKDKTYHRNAKALAALEFTKKKELAARQYEALIKKLSKFSNDRFKVNWTEQDADNALLRYLDKHSPTILGVIVEGGELPGQVKEMHGTDYIVGSFIADMHTSDPEGFEFFGDYRKGNNACRSVALSRSRASPKSL